MPVFHHTKTHRRFFFIHIPRNAGRFLTQNFLENGYGIEHHSTRDCTGEDVVAQYGSLNGPQLLHPPTKHADKERVEDYLWTLIEGVQFSHTHYPLYSKWKSIKDIPSITVVRNPVDRFFSASGVMEEGLQSSLENWTEFNNILQKIMPKKFNWWRPQYEFISPHTKIWKYENGFGKDFCKWIKDIFPIEFSIRTQGYEKSTSDALKLIKTEPLVNNLKKFYHQDFKDFDYE
tara:strand:- start:46 stop:741 length:696 start_codon:yes stop_codon:yes gene_type:complete